MVPCYYFHVLSLLVLILDWFYLSSCAFWILDVKFVNILLVCLIWKSLVCYIGDCLSNHFYFFGGDRKLMKVGLYSHHIGLVGCQKFHFEILFSFRLPIFDPCVLLFANNFFLFKKKPFLKRSLWKSISKIHFHFFFF